MRLDPPCLTTTRLRLRPVEALDAAPTAALVTADVAANLSTWPSPMTDAQARERIRESRDRLANRSAIDLAITDRQTGALVGWIGLASLSPATARLGYWLGTRFRGRGLMKEVMAAAVPASASFLDARRVVALVLKGNAASIAVLRSTGFRLVGEEVVFFEVARESRPCFRFEWEAGEDC